MNNTKEIIVQCKRCNNSQKFTYLKSIHISLRSIEKRNSFLNSLFTDFICEKCGWTSFIKRDFLYDDTGNHYLFWLINPNDNGEILIPAESFKIYSLYENDYVFRVVTSYEELIEKIKIYDDGFYDLQVEISKLLLSSKARIKLSEPFYYAGVNGNNKSVFFSLPRNEFHDEIEYPISEMKKINQYVNDHLEFNDIIFGKFVYLNRGMLSDFMNKHSLFK